MIVGCDPGLTGALSLIDDRTGLLLEVADIPTCTNGIESGSMKRWVDVEALRTLLADWSSRYDFAGWGARGIIERPIPMPSLPAQTIASQFDTFGTLRAVIAERVDSMAFVNPQAWKKLFGIGDDKTKARTTVVALYPNAPVSRAKDHNRAEAILIGHWLLRTTQ